MFLEGRHACPLTPRDSFYFVCCSAAGPAQAARGESTADSPCGAVRTGRCANEAGRKTGSFQAQSKWIFHRKRARRCLQEKPGQRLPQRLHQVKDRGLKGTDAADTHPWGRFMVDQTRAIAAEASFISLNCLAG